MRGSAEGLWCAVVSDCSWGALQPPSLCGATGALSPLPAVPPGISRLDDQIFLNRNPGVPSVVKFHPFTPCIAVADKDSIW